MLVLVLKFSRINAATLNLRPNLRVSGNIAV